MELKDIVVVGASRSPMGLFGGSLKDMSVLEMYTLAEQVKQFQQGGIGIYPVVAKPADETMYLGGFIHVDIRPQRARWAMYEGEYLPIWDGVRLMVENKFQPPPGWTPPEEDNE